jgi:hypothetical protein
MRCWFRFENPKHPDDILWEFGPVVNGFFGCGSMETLA